MAIYDIIVTADTITVVSESPGERSLSNPSASSRVRRSHILSNYLEAGAALAHAHARGVVHGRFAERCVLFGRDETVKVDFSTTLATSPGQESAPEADPLDDQYAFCLALWRALTDTDPARDGEGTPIWPKSRPSSPRVVRALTRGLAHEAHDRFATMDLLLDVLRPRRARGLAIAGAVGFAVTLFGGSAATIGYLEDQSRCSSGQELVARAWGNRRSRVREAVLATGVPYAEPTWQRIEHHLERYSSQWARTYASACEVSTREQGPEALDLRLACLRRAHVSLAASVDVLLESDAETVAKAVELVSELPMITRCDDIDRLRLETPPPSTPREEAVVEHAREQLFSKSEPKGLGTRARVVSSALGRLILA